ncbi:MAG: MmcQ/YjbR family DNA-binding protein [Bacteroidetes bacterium]|nr:MmcQ/YjbR family DNA-binding protein [Bacteroidota bacterium]
MNIDSICEICRGLPSVTEEIKWGSDLCFMVGGKMFCVVVPDNPLKVSVKVPDEEFEVISSSPGIIPAPYAARHKWVLVEDVSVWNKTKWNQRITESYNLVKSRLSIKKQISLGTKKK